MSHGVVLNHFSLPFAHKEDAVNGLLVFLKVMAACRAVGLRILILDEDQDKSLMGLELANGYYVRDWYASSNKLGEVIDWCRLLRSLETKQPLFEKPAVAEVGDTVEVGLPGESSGKSVLLAALYLETFLISFTALTTWQASHITVWVLDLARNPDLRDEALLNLCDDDCLKVHEQELKRRRDVLIDSAKDIWLQRSDMFPHLTLLANQIGTSLKNWSARKDVLWKARDALNVLERFCSEWIAGNYVEYRHEYLRDLGMAAEVSGESSSVCKDSRKKKERMFWLDDGREVFCENHVKLPDGYRMHFYPDSDKKRIYVAYLGPHLTL